MKSYACGHLGSIPHRPTTVSVFADGYDAASLAYLACKSCYAACTASFTDDDVYNDFKALAFGANHSDDGWHYFVRFEFNHSNGVMFSLVESDSALPRIGDALRLMDEEVFGACGSRNLFDFDGVTIREMVRSLKHYVQDELELDYSLY